MIDVEGGVDWILVLIRDTMVNLIPPVVEGCVGNFRPRGIQLFVIDVEIGIDWILALDSGHDGDIEITVGR